MIAGSVLPGMKCVELGMFFVPFVCKGMLIRSQLSGVVEATSSL